jgi:hypothetical protein
MKWLVTIALLVHAGPAIAEEINASADARAKVLFDEGKTLFAEGNYGKACEKLDASFKLSRLSGTRGLLAACFEKIGKLASAWVAYRDSAAIADKQGHAERAQAARDKAAELAPKLAWLTLEARASKQLAGFKVTIDGIEQPVSSLDSALPIDGGPHVVEADAPHYKPWRKTLDVEDGEKQTVAIEALVYDPSEENVARSKEKSSRRKVIGLGIAGSGVAAVGVAVAFGVSAKLGWDSARDAGCNSDGVCPNQSSKTKLESASRNANVASVFGVAGLVVAGAGLALYFTAPKTERATIVPAIGREGASVLVQGRF